MPFGKANWTENEEGSLQFTLDLFKKSNCVLKSFFGFHESLITQTLTRTQYNLAKSAKHQEFET